jgi:riboflavin synthase
MFTGIIQEVGVIKDIKAQDRGRVVSIASHQVIKQARVGSSVSVNGVCSTVIKKTRSYFAVNYMPETVRLTTVKKLQLGQKVNLEPSLRVGDELSGHLAFGHVDGVGRVTKVSNRGKDVVVEVTAPKSFGKYLSRKGSISLDGVSLTIVESRGNTFQFALIPYTLKATILNSLKAGDQVNLEVDMLAKYVVNYLENVKRK